jgi:hypothetical protein
VRGLQRTFWGIGPVQMSSATAHGQILRGAWRMISGYTLCPKCGSFCQRATRGPCVCRCRAHEGETRSVSHHASTRQWGRGRGPGLSRPHARVCVRVRGGRCGCACEHCVRTAWSGGCSSPF